MHIKIGKVEANVNGLLVLVGLLVADGMYANHCRVKHYNKKLDAIAKINSKNSQEEEESNQDFFSFFAKLTTPTMRKE